MGKTSTAMNAKLSNILRSFRADPRGTTSLMFAGGILAAVIITAAAVDYSTAVTTRARLQAGVEFRGPRRGEAGRHEPRNLHQ